MKTRLRTSVLLVAAMLMLPNQLSALSVRQYEERTTNQRAEFVANAIEKIIADVAKVNPALSTAIRDYFYVTPVDRPAALGVTAFEGELLAVENLADKGKLDLDKVQIEGILLDIIKTDVMAKQKPKDR